MASADGETVLFKSVFTDKYVRPLVEYARPTELTKGRLSADGKGDPKMYLERASTGSGLYHIKSHETNKYWQLKSANNLWIVAQADAPNENNSWECTLFEIEYFVAPVAPVTPATTATAGTTTTTVRLRHHYRQSYIYVCRASDAYPHCLFAMSDEIDNDSKDVFVREEFRFN